MIAATYTEGGGFSVCDVPEPRIGSHDLLLRVQAASICGTDLKIIRSGHRKLAAGQSIVLGHEFVGTIERIGDAAQGYHVGQRVGVVPNAGCGRCDACLRGRANYCPQYSGFGIDRDGGHASLVTIPARFVAQSNVMALPDSISDEAASLIEPLSCVVSGARAARIGLGDTVVIYGAGPMGLLHLMLARLAGAGTLIVVDPQASRLAQAGRLGCDILLPPSGDVLSTVDRVLQETAGEGADVVITACPVAEVQTEAVELLKPFGRLCLFGSLPPGASRVPLDTNRIHYRNLHVTGTTGGSADDYRIALQLVAGRRIDPTLVVSDRFPLSQLEAGYERALSGAAGKVAFVADCESSGRE